MAALASTGTVPSNGVDLTYELFGDPSATPLLMIHGLGAQYTDWDPRFFDLLVAHGYFVIAFDNRDQGTSTWFDHAGTPDFLSILSGDTSSAPYLLSDMAADAAGLLDALGISAAHIFGVSMGGMIAQQFVIDFPKKSLSLTSIMSTPDATSVGQPTPEATAALMVEPATTREGAIEQSITTSQVIGSPGFPFDEVLARERAGIHFDRGHHPEGTARQMAAIFCSEDRRPGLAHVTVPTLIIHGDADPLVTPPGGLATVDAVKDSSLWVVEGMGHDMPKDIWPELMARHAELVNKTS